MSNAPQESQSINVFILNRDIAKSNSEIGIFFLLTNWLKPSAQLVDPEHLGFTFSFQGLNLLENVLASLVELGLVSAVPAL